jgi:ribose/xylose/arabinose/galactoside ABC-type transport system permease subunit
VLQDRANPKQALLFQEAGLLLVILFLGGLLTIFGGRVERPIFETKPTGEREQRMVKENKFFNPQSLMNIAKDTSFIAVMAVGATIVIISGGIDLSVGSIYALASVLGAMYFHSVGPEGATPTESVKTILMGVLICVGSGATCGLLNGLLIVGLRVHPFIITLGTMAMLRGLAFVLTNGQSVGSFPAGFRDLVRWEVGRNLSPVPLLMMIVVAVCGWIFLSRMVQGRRVYAIGGNELASRFSGIPVERVKLAVYLISGLTAGVAALLSIGYYGAATSGDGSGYELNVIAAAVVGGASLAGGKGSALGALLGALIIQLISSAIIILDINQNYSQIITGAVVVLAVVLDQVNGWLTKRRLAARAGST